ncbi:hypothetical protein HDV57DRAFT_334958 [Trichoderma longibrachiatum]
MAGRLTDFRTSRVASRRGPRPCKPLPRALTPCDDAPGLGLGRGLGLGPGLYSGLHMHMLAFRLACFSVIASRPGPNLLRDKAGSSEERDPIEARANASVSASSRPKRQQRACDGEADGAAGPFISRCCDLSGALGVWPYSTTAYLYDEFPRMGVVVVPIPEESSALLQHCPRRPNGSVPSCQLPLVLDLLHSASGVASKRADEQLMCCLS